MGPMPIKLKSLHPSRGQWFFLVIALFSIYFVLPQIGIFRHSFSHLSGANWHYLGLALGFALATNFMAAITYGLLAKHPLNFGKTLLVQLSGNFVNRLLPAGIGAIGINYAYLRANRHDLPQSASVVASNNLVGAIGHLLLIIFVFIGLRSKPDDFQWQGLHFEQGWRYLALFLIISTVVILLFRFRYKAITSFKAVIKQLLDYRHRLINVGLSLLSSISLTLFNVLSLYYCLSGLHFHLSLASVLIVFTFGVALGTATPTPGGLGGIDAGLVVGLVAFHLPVSLALAVTLVYRLISCWLPVLLGAGVFYVTERQGFYKRNN